MMEVLSKNGKLYECKEKPGYLPHCHYCSFNYLFKLGKLICGKPDKNYNCECRKEIKNWKKKIKEM